MAGQDLCRLITLVEKNKRMATKWVTRVRPKKTIAGLESLVGKLEVDFCGDFWARRVLGFFFRFFTRVCFSFKQKLVLEMKFVEWSFFGFFYRYFGIQQLFIT